MISMIIAIGEYSIMFFKLLFSAQIAYQSFVFQLTGIP